MAFGDTLKQTLQRSKSIFSDFVKKSTKSVSYNLQKNGPPNVAATKAVLKGVGKGIQAGGSWLQGLVDKSLSTFDKPTMSGAEKFMPQQDIAFKNLSITPQEAKGGGKLTKDVLDFGVKSYGRTLEKIGTKGVGAFDPRKPFDALENVANVADLATLGGASLAIGGLKAFKSGDKLADMYKAVSKTGGGEDFLAAVVRSGRGILDRPSGLVKVSDGAGNLVNLGRITRAKQKVLDAVGMLDVNEDLVRSRFNNQKGFVSMDELKDKAKKLFTKGANTVGQAFEAGSPEDLADIKNKVNAYLNSDMVARSKQTALRKPQLAKKFGMVEDIGQRVGGKEGYILQKQALEGELAKINIKGLNEILGEGNLPKVLDVIQSSTALDTMEKFNAKTAMFKAFAGEVLQKNESDLLRKVFPEDIVSGFLRNNKFLSKAADYLGLARAFQASGDILPMFRQGAFLVTRPKFWTSAPDAIKGFFSPKYYDEMMDAIKTHPRFELANEVGLALTDFGGKREEAFASNLAEKIPVIGDILVKPSTRGYTGYLNKLRFDLWNEMLDGAVAKGMDEGEVARSLAEYINTASGRGGLKELEGSLGKLSTVLFSPRLMLSRFNLLFNPAFYMKMHPYVRQQAVRDWLGFAGTVFTIATLAEMAGAKVGKDPRSSDFLKVKIGDTRYDLTGGFQQYLKVAYQLYTGEVISTRTGKVMKLNDKEQYRGLNKLDIATRFLEYKYAPIVSLLTDSLRGEDVLGNEFKWNKAIRDRFIPIVAQDIIDIYKDRGAAGLPMIAPAFFGVGQSTYETKKIIKKAPKSNTNKSKAKDVFSPRLIPQ